MNIGEKLVKNVISNWLAYFVNIVISFFMMPFIIKSLGDTRYGIWVLIGSLTGYLGLFDLGIATSIHKYVAEYYSKKDNKSLNSFISTSYVAYLLIGVVVFLVTIFLAINFNRFFLSASNLIPETRLVMVIVGFNIAIGFPLGVLGGIVRGLQRFDINSLVETVAFVVKSFLVIIMLKAGYGLVALAVISLVTTVIAHVWRAIYAYFIYPELKISFSFFQKSFLKKIFKYSIFSFVLAVATKIIFYTDSIVIGVFLSSAAITYYSIGGRLVEYIRQVILEMIGVILPTASSFDAQNDKDKIRKLLIAGTKYSMIVFIPFAAFLFVMGKDFIALWMGAQYVDRTISVLFILLFSQFFAVSQIASGTILLGVNKHRFLALLSMVEALVNLILSLVLVRKMGIVGVAIGTAIPLIVNNFIILPVYVCKVLGVPVVEYVKKSMVSPLLVMVPLIGLLYFMQKIVANPGWILLGLEFMISWLFFMVIVWRFCLSKLERDYFCHNFLTLVGLK
ncbi:MAG: putative membrane protein EpsK [Pelotomaculum sp. PtaU1.Bin065]|nr:MAG: putative membrane protein EpsK [Pelotomaculum sp. PtaU1.Bin065]